MNAAICDTLQFSLICTPMKQKKVFLLERCPHLRGVRTTFGERKCVLIREFSLIQRFSFR